MTYSCAGRPPRIRPLIRHGRSGAHSRGRPPPRWGASCRAPVAESVLEHPDFASNVNFPNPGRPASAGPLTLARAPGARTDPRHAPRSRPRTTRGVPDLVTGSAFRRGRGRIQGRKAMSDAALHARPPNRACTPLAAYDPDRRGVLCVAAKPCPAAMIAGAM